MGYRNYIASIPKKEYDKIKNFTKEKLYKYKKESLKDGYVGVYNVAHNTLYELGKYCEFGGKEFFKPVFKNKKLQKEFTEEHDFYIVGREFLAHIIEDYNKKIQSYYNEMVMPFLGAKDYQASEFLNSAKYNYSNDSYTLDFSKITDEQQTQLVKMIEHVRSMRTEWVQLTPYNLEKGDTVTQSWKYEYAVFELVRIYKTFDWKNNIMIYYGY